LQRYFIVRTSWLHGPGGKNFVTTILRLAAERDELRIVADQVGSPTYTGDLAEALLRLLASAGQGEAFDGYGLYHFANAGQCSWCEFADAIVAEARHHGETLAVNRVVPIATADYPLPAPRPAWSVLSTQRYRAVTGSAPPPWRDGLARHLAELFGRGDAACENTSGTGSQLP
jgi:dTDP-4-dehydrorhamnose reductase